MHQYKPKESEAKHRRKMAAIDSASFGVYWGFQKAKQYSDGADRADGAPADEADGADGADGAAGAA